MLTMQHDKLSSLIQQAEHYFSLSTKPVLTEIEQLKLTVCRQTIENHNISTQAEFDRLKTLFRDTDKKLAALKENFKNCQQMYDVYFDIARTYYDISKGDYISRLVEEEKQRQEREAQKKKKTAI